MHPYSALVMLLTACSPETQAVASAYDRATPPKASQVTFIDYLQGQTLPPLASVLNSPKPEVCPFYPPAADSSPPWGQDASATDLASTKTP